MSKIELHKPLDVKEYQDLGINTNSNHFKRFYNAGLLEKIDYKFIEEVKDYWEKYYSKKIDPIFHLAFYNHTGLKDPRLVPSREMWNEIIPFFNDMNIRIGYSDKNTYDTLINPPTHNSVENIIKRVRGNYYDKYNNNIDRQNVINIMKDTKEDLIIKPSDSDNGQGIAKLIFRDHSFFLDNEMVDILKLEEMYGFNFIIQKLIQQHPIMAKPHPASVNTLRLVTFRWNKKIHHLLTYARFGGNNNVKDHAVSGGVSVGVTDTGELMDFAIDTNCNVYTHHPTTNYPFSNKLKIPNYDVFKEFVIDLHKKILHHDYVSWDVAVGPKSQPIFIEANFRGTSWRYQLVSRKPIFGDLTEEVIKYVRNELKKNGFNRNVKSNVPKIREENRKLKNEKKELVQTNKILKQNNKSNKQEIKRKNILLKKKIDKISRLKHENKKIKESRSWKYTTYFRKLGGAYRKIIK